jgi:hypothetical protein
MKCAHGTLIDSAHAMAQVASSLVIRMILTS